MNFGLRMADSQVMLLCRWSMAHFANYPTTHVRLVHQKPKIISKHIFFETLNLEKKKVLSIKTLAICSLTRSLQSMRFQVPPEGTNNKDLQTLPLRGCSNNT